MRALPRLATLWVPLGLAALTVALKVPTLDTPAYWDEIAWLQQARWLSEHDLVTALPGLHPPSDFWGHPPGLHLAVAAIWKLVGYSIASAHLLMAAFAALGVAATYLLGRQLVDWFTGLFAALFLLSSPVYLAQSGMFLADLPLAALGALSIYFGLRGRSAAYLLGATAMVFIKETAIALVVAFLVYLLLTLDRRAPETWRRILLYSVPLWLIGLFFVAQKVATGHFFFIYEFDVDLFYLEPVAVVRQVRRITRWIFVEQGRFIFTLLIAAALLGSRAARRRRELLLVALIVAVFGYAFSVLLLLPRYLLPVLPFFYLLGVMSLVDVLPRKPLQIAAAGVLLVALAASARSQPFVGNAEFDLNYLDVARLNREMSSYVERRFPGATVLAAWPQSVQLRTPELGYVTRCVEVVAFEPPAPAGQADLIFVSVPWTHRQAALREHAQQPDWRLIHRLAKGEIVVELYGPAPVGG